MNREDCLKNAQICVCGERDRDYGSPEDNFSMIALLWGDYLSTTIDRKDVAAMMALMKIARIATATGQPIDDCWVDIAGYAACGAEMASVN